MTITQFLEYPDKPVYHYRDYRGDARGTKPLCSWYNAYGPHQEQYVVGAPSDGRYLCGTCYGTAQRLARWEGLKLPPRTPWEQAHPRPEQKR